MIYDTVHTKIYSKEINNPSTYHFFIDIKDFRFFFALVLRPFFKSPLLFSLNYQSADKDYYIIVNSLFNIMLRYLERSNSQEVVNSKS